MSQFSEAAPSADIQTSEATGSITPQERLANSRKALVRHMTRNQPSGRAVPANVDASSLGAGVGVDGNPDFSAAHFDPKAADNSSDGQNRSTVFSLAQQALMTWWQHHPAHLAVDIARPLLSQFAEKKPVRLLAIAAVVGALLVLFKPWRMVTPAGVLLGTLKSSGLFNMLLSLLSGVGRK